MQETWILSLGWEDPPEKEMVTHSSILAWEIPWTEELGRIQPMGLQRVRHKLSTETTEHYSSVSGSELQLTKKRVLKYSKR